MRSAAPSGSKADGMGGMPVDATDTEHSGSAAFGRSMVRANYFNP
ncbi:MAG: hypothetical protein WCI94_07760 [Rhodospirillales bacterium]